MTVETETRDYLNKYLPEPSGYWLDHYAEMRTEDRGTMAKLSLFALSTYKGVNGQEPVKWTVEKASGQMKRYLNQSSERSDLLINAACQQVFLDLDSMKLLTRYTLHEESDGVSTFTLQDWKTKEIEEYEQFLSAIVSCEPVDTSQE